jgi:hypothetical protein
MSSRREILAATLSAFPIYALLSELSSAIADDRRLAPRRWIARQDELARGLADGTVSPLSWHDAVNALAAEVDIPALLAAIRGADLRSAGVPFGHDPQKRFVRFSGTDGSPIHLAYAVALFSFGPGDLITPHAHRHMASAHLVLEGRMRIRTFDRIADELHALVIRPTADIIAEPGHAAAMTSAKDNIHWFAPRSRTATTFDVIVDGLDPGAEPYVIQPLDPLGGEHRADGTIRAPLLTFAQSSERYNSAI